MSATTTQAPPSNFHSVPMQAEYQKEHTTTYTPAPMQGYSSYQALQQGVPNVSIFLRPIAAPSALGWMSYFGGTFMVFTWLADWYGGNNTYFDVTAFVFFFGGLCQLIAGIYGYQARDNFATVWFPLWGAFFLSWGFYYTFQLPLEFGAATVPAQVDIARHGVNDGLGMWFVILTGVSWACFLPALARDLTTGLIVFLASIGVTLELAYLSSVDGERNTLKAGAYFILLSGLVGLFRGWLYLMEEAYVEATSSSASGLGSFINGLRFSSPFSVNKSPVTVGVNEPGVKKAQ